MKSNIQVFLLVVIILLLSGCGGGQNSAAAHETAAELSTAPAVTGAIKLHPDDSALFPFDLPFPQTYRACYYRIDGCFEALVSETDSDFTQSLTYDVPADGPNVMMVKAFVQQYGIPKEQFEKALAEEKQAHISLGHDVTDEQYELPNADIVYTFDDATINAYYCRESPVLRCLRGVLQKKTCECRQ